MVAPEPHVLAQIPDEAPRVLVVCTANVSRSPLAAELLRHRLADQHVGVHVASAGVNAVSLDVDPLAVEAGYELSVNIAAHRPRRLSQAILEVDGADLVIGMTREHVREIVLLNETAWTRTFTLKELVRLLHANRPEIIKVPSQWRSSIGQGRSMADLIGESSADDVFDPYGRSAATHRIVAQEMSTLVSVVVDDLLRWVVRA